MLKILSERDLKIRHHVAYDTVLGMENEFSEHAEVEIVRLSKVWGFFNKCLHKIAKRRLPDYAVKRLPKDWYLFIAMDAGALETNKETLRKLSDHGCRVSIYCFDTWEKEYARWDGLLRYIKPSAIFLAYQQSVEYFARTFQNVYFLPQSMDKTFFHDYGEKKERLFMQMGRKNESIHRKILAYMKAHHIEETPENYIYEKVKGKIIFEETGDLARNINRTKFFVCAPQALENAALTGRVADVTARYYEAMACKTMIIGYKPAHVFDELFPYHAMIDLREENFDSAIEYYLSHPEEYNAVVEKNYAYVMERHTWTNRLDTMLALLKNTVD